MLLEVALRSRLAVPLLLAILACAPSAHAEDAELARARALFEEAGDLEAKGEWAAAQERLRSALKIRETANLHYALAWALEQDDRHRDARSEYETSLRLARQSGNEAVSKLASARLKELDRSRKGKPLPWVFVGGGAALVGSGALLVGWASGSGPMQVTGGVIAGVGAIGIGTGVYLLLHDDAREAASRSALRIDAAPLAGGGLASASFVF